MAASRYAATVERFPDPVNRTCSPASTLGEPQRPWTPLVRLDDAIERRRSNRREFFEHRVSEEIVWELTTAAAAEGAVVVTTEDPAQRRIVADLIREADRDRERRPRLPGRAPAVDDLHDHAAATA